MRWVLRCDSGNYATGGDDQADTPEFPDAVTRSDITTAQVRIPDGGGAYRLFGYAYDGHGNAAVANVPIKVEGKELPPPLPLAHVPFAVYTEAGGSSPFIPSGYMGNTGAIDMDPACTGAGETCVSLGIPAPLSNVGACTCLLYTSPSPRDRQKSRMPSSA